MENLEEINLVYQTFQSMKVQCLTQTVWPEFFRGGPVLGSDPISMRLRHNRDERVADGFAEDVDYPLKLEGEWNYAGVAYTHFGHFLSECVHRIIPSRRLWSCDRWLFVSLQSDSSPIEDFDTLMPFMQEILLFLDMKPEKIKIIRQNAIIDTLNISEQGSTFYGGPSPGYVPELGRFSKNRLSYREKDKVYVSRSALPPGGQILGEKYIEALLEEEGFNIFHPEKHSF